MTATEMDKQYHQTDQLDYYQEGVKYWFRDDDRGAVVVLTAMADAEHWQMGMKITKIRTSLIWPSYFCRDFP